MKKILVAFAVILNCSFLVAQTEFDAFKMVQNDINGTARYMSMAGAFGALGGDASAIKDNPAGLGIYRSSELMGSINLMLQQNNATWYGQSTLDDIYKVKFNNFSYVIATPTWRSESGSGGLQSSNFSFAYNRLRNFNRSLTVQGGSSLASMTDYMGYFTGNKTGNDLAYVEDSYEPFDNIAVPWLSVLAYEGGLINERVANGASSWSSLLNENETVTPTYQLLEKGYHDEYSIGWAGNFSNVFYLGATLNLQAINYSAFSTYSESFAGNGSMSLKDSIYTSGTGFNFKIGTIISPLDFLRLGLSLHTPSIYKLNDTYYTTLDYDTDRAGYISTPGARSAYQIQSPLVVNASIGLLVGQKGLISAEYNYNNYTGTRLRNSNGDSQSFGAENQGMANVLNDVRTIKVGGELRVTDNFSLRAGYANSSSAHKTNAEKLMRRNTLRTDTEYFINNRIDYLTAGFGYHEEGWFVDFAYMNKMSDDKFYPYNHKAVQVEPANITTTNHNMAITLGFRF